MSRRKPIEIRICQQCQKEFRLPHKNNPGKFFRLAPNPYARRGFGFCLFTH